MKFSKNTSTEDYEIERSWPVITQQALGEAQLSGSPDNWKSELSATCRGYIHLANAEIELRRLSRSTNPTLAIRATEILTALEALRSRWPITIV